jgi:hypothetical protein
MVYDLPRADQISVARTICAKEQLAKSGLKAWRRAWLTVGERSLTCNATGGQSADP